MADWIKPLLSHFGPEVADRSHRWPGELKKNPESSSYFGQEEYKCSPKEGCPCADRYFKMKRFVVTLRR
jgi:hypothetical protein